MIGLGAGTPHEQARSSAAYALLRIEPACGAPPAAIADRRAAAARGDAANSPRAPYCLQSSQSILRQWVFFMGHLAILGKSPRRGVEIWSCGSQWRDRQWLSVLRVHEISFLTPPNTGSRNLTLGRRRRGGWIGSHLRSRPSGGVFKKCGANHSQGESQGSRRNICRDRFPLRPAYSEN